MKKIYKIYAHFMGKDLDTKSLIGVLIADNDKEVATLISTIGFDEGWENYYDYETLEEIIMNKGDRQEEYMGEFYDIKYSWESVCEATDELLSSIAKLGIEIKEYEDLPS